MIQSHKFWVVLVCAATLLTAFICLFNINGTREKALQLIKPDLIEENGHLKTENAYLKSELDGLNKLNRSLRKYLDCIPKLIDFLLLQKNFSLFFVFKLD